MPPRGWPGADCPEREEPGRGPRSDLMKYVHPQLRATEVTGANGGPLGLTLVDFLSRRCPMSESASSPPVPSGCCGLRVFRSERAADPDEDRRDRAVAVQPGAAGDP